MGQYILSLLLTTSFEEIKMEDDESFDEFYTKLNE